MEVFWLEQTVADVSCDDAWLSDSETMRCSTLHVPKRRADWRLGRWTAKQAVASRLHLPHDSETLAAIEIRPDAFGAPEVFLSDRPASVCISISHSTGVAACAVAPAGATVGCDLEVVEPRDPAFVTDYFTAEEQEAISQAAKSQRDTLITLLWSAKESALKALRTGLRLDTRCVAGNIGEYVPLIANTWATLSVCCPDDQIFEGWWRCSDELVRTIVTVPSFGPPVVVAQNCRNREHTDPRTTCGNRASRLP